MIFKDKTKNYPQTGKLLNLYLQDEKDKTISMSQKKVFTESLWTEGTGFFTEKVKKIDLENKLIKEKSYLQASLVELNEKEIARNFLITDQRKNKIISWKDILDQIIVERFFRVKDSAFGSAKARKTEQGGGDVLQEFQMGEILIVLNEVSGKEVSAGGIKSNKWYNVKLKNGKYGYIWAPRLEKIPNFAYEIEKIQKPKKGCNWDGKDKCIFNISLKNMGGSTWEISDFNYKLKKKNSLQGSKWIRENIKEQNIEYGDVLNLKVYYNDVMNPNENEKMIYEFWNFQNKIKGSEIVLNTILNEREFKTSIKDVIIYKEKSEKSEKTFTILKVKEKIIVLGKAEKGIYSEKYKTDRWFKIKYTENGESFNGFVVATTVRPEWIELKILTNNCYTNLIKKKGFKRKRIVLHATGSNNSLDIEWSGFNNCANEKSAHFIVDRQGKIRQSVQDFNAAWHAYPDNSNSIGIEISNWGFDKRMNKNEIIDISKKFPEIWEVWNHSKNKSEQDPTAKTQYWQNFTEQQYKSLRKLLNITEEKFGIKDNLFSYEIKGEKQKDLSQYAFYYSPQRIDWSKCFYKKIKNGESKRFCDDTKTWSLFEKERIKFNGIVSHKNISSKFDTGPALNLKKLKLLTP